MNNKRERRGKKITGREKREREKSSGEATSKAISSEGRRPKESFPAYLPTQPHPQSVIRTGKLAVSSFHQQSISQAENLSHLNELIE